MSNPQRLFPVTVAADSVMRFDPRRGLARWMPRWMMAGFTLFVACTVHAQELEPGAYSPAPVGFNIALASYTHSSGDLAFDASVPITEASASINQAVFGYVRTLDVAGRQASVAFALPYARGDLEGLLFGEPASAYRSGIADPRIRLAINLYGSPALTPKEFATRPPDKWIFGTSLGISLPLGQYDPDKLINIGQNRWAFKPEFGLSRTAGKWVVEIDAGAWFYLDNTDFYGGQTRHRDPLVSTQWHIIYNFRPRMWLALDANYYSGGRTTLNGVQKNDEQHNSRMGLTFALPLNQQHSLKFSYSRGAITNIGADFASYGVAWQYAWR